MAVAAIATSRRRVLIMGIAATTATAMHDQIGVRNVGGPWRGGESGKR